MLFEVKMVGCVCWLKWLLLLFILVGRAIPVRLVFATETMTWGDLGRNINDLFPPLL